MNSIILKFFICFNIFLFANIVNPVLLRAEKVSSEPWDQALGLLNTNEILTVSQRGKLKIFLDQIVNQKDRNQYLSQSLLNRMDQKIADDRFQMQALLETLEQISQNHIAEKMGNIDKGKLNDCLAKLEELNRAIRDDNPVFKYDDRSANINYVQKIKDKSFFLLGGGGGPNFPELWKAVKKMVLPVYPKWNHLAAGLEQRNKTRINNSIGKEYPSIEERRFLELFTQVQYNLRRFSEIRSDEF